MADTIAEKLVRKVEELKAKSEVTPLDRYDLRLASEYLEFIVQVERRERRC